MLLHAWHIECCGTCQDIFVGDCEEANGILWLYAPTAITSLSYVSWNFCELPATALALSLGSVFPADPPGSEKLTGDVAGI